MGELDESFNAWTTVWRSNDFTIDNSTATSCHNQRRLISAIARKIRQSHHQQDSATTSRHGQRQLGSGITSKTRQRRHTMANVNLAAASPARLGSVIASMT
jgi:hypothetical protein